MTEHESHQQIDTVELLDMIEDLVHQGCHVVSTDPLELDDGALSTYEDAMELLVRCRPRKWVLTKRGMRQRP